MSNFFISYDLGDSSDRTSDYEKIENYLKNHLRAQRILLNLWMYDSSSSLFSPTVTNIRDKLMHLFQPNDRWLVVESINWEVINSLQRDIPPN
jgi:hypothetical protein